MTPTGALSSSRPQARTGDAILVVDDHELVRLGFRALVEAQRAQAEHTPLGMHEAATLEQALSLYARYAADISVVVLDLALPDVQGLDGLMAFRQRHPGAAVVVLSGTASPATAQHTLDLGAVAFFSKTGDLRPMLEFVHTCASAGVNVARARRTLVAAPSVASLSAVPQHGDSTQPTGRNALTTRQLQILQWLLEGRSNREISSLANLSEGTVKNHVSMLLLTFAVRSRAQLISKLRT